MLSAEALLICSIELKVFHAAAQVFTAIGCLTCTFYVTQKIGTVYGIFFHAETLFLPF